MIKIVFSNRYTTNRNSYTYLLLIITQHYINYIVASKDKH